MTLRELANTLVKLEDPPRFDDKRPKSIAYVDEIPEYFVWPDLGEVSRREGSRLLLVEAPGAVGKSTAARAVAAVSHWPLVDSSKAQVGSYSLSGLISDAFGIGSRFPNDLVEGRAGIIIDALDEAHLRVGTNNFEAFLDNVARIADSSSSVRCNIILFSRPDTASIIAAKLDEVGCAFDVFRLSYFNYAQACAYISAYLKGQAARGREGAYDVESRHPQAFASFRDSGLLAIASSLANNDNLDLEADWEVAENFLGYAPVLSVLAESMAVTNPFRVQMSEVERGMSPERILLDVIDEILEREQGKFYSQTIARLWARLPVEQEWLKSEEIYSSAEQRVRLVSRLFDCGLVVQPPATLPASLRDSYELLAQQFTADHPFLAGRGAVNIVFADYLSAVAAVDRDCHLALRPSPAHRVESVGPFFYQFVHRFAPSAAEAEMGGRKLARVDDELLPLLVESQAAAGVASNRPSFTYVNTGDRPGIALLTDTSTTAERTLDFEVLNTVEILYFRDRLARAVIYTRGMVVLGERGRRFFLGPAASVISPSILLDAELLSVDGRLPNGQQWVSLLFTEGESIQAPNLKSVDLEDSRHFGVVDANVWPILRPYVVADSSVQSPQDQIDYVSLRAILRSFRKGMGSGQPAIYYEKLEQRVVKSDDSRLRLLRRLQEIGIIYRDGSVYRLAIDKLADMSISLQAIDLGYPNDHVLQLLALLRGE